MLRRAHRREEGAFLVEGNRAIADSIDAGASVEELFVAEDLAGDPLVRRARGAGITIHEVGRPIVKAISDAVTPQGIVAVISSPLVELDDVAVSNGLIIVLAGIGDPGNVGTLIRTAAAAGADAVILTEGSSDPLNPKTARASASALFATSIVADVSIEAAVDRCRALGCSTVGTDAGAEASIYDSDLTGPVALVLGNESWGLPEAERDLLDLALSIPMPGAMESLNVAMAGSIVVFEVLRQRRGRDVSTVSSASKEA